MEAGDVYPLHLVLLKPYEQSTVPLLCGYATQRAP